MDIQSLPHAITTETELSRFEKLVYNEIENERKRAGGFNRILPDERYTHLFESRRYLEEFAVRVIRGETEEHTSDSVV